MFSNRRQLRRWAAQVLLLWLFGVSTGVANACWAGSLARLEGHLPPVVATQAVQGDDEAPAECELHAMSHAQGKAGSGDPAGSGARICHTYCDMSALSFSPLKSSLDHSPGPALPASTYAFTLPPPEVSPVHLRAPRRYGALAPPITIAFLRLTL